MTLAVSIAEELLERERELERLGELVRAVAAGSGRIVLVEGEAGIGKTALLGAARGLARAAGFTVLAARGGELERDFAHGVSRQLFEPLLRRAPETQRRRLLRGAAALAAPVLGVGERASQEEATRVDATFAANHGLYWLTAGLSDERPLLLIVDDAHWADLPTLHFLHYLGRRIDELPVLVALALRPADHPTQHELLDAVHALDAAQSLSPSELSRDGARMLVERLLGAPPAGVFSDACHEATGGNPFLLAELARAIAAEGEHPSNAAAARVRLLAPRSIARSVLSRLAATGPEPLALARAVAVLDTDAEVRHAAALAQLEMGAAERAADALAGARVLGPGRPLRFAHPIMRQAVYEDLPEGRRAAAHARAAQLLDAEGPDPDRAAVHLLASEPAGDAWVLDRLRAAAARALARGAPDMAVELLRRALAEPPTSRERTGTLLELGRAERIAGATDAVAHLQQAWEEAATDALRAEAASELATALATDARLEDAVRLLEEAIDEAPDRERALLLEAQLFGLSQASDVLAARVGPRLERVCIGMIGDTPGERLALAANVFHRTFLGLGTGEEVAALARRALGNGQLLREATGDHFAFYGPLIALRDSDNHDELGPLLEDALADARARGSAAAIALTLSTLARLEQLQGQLARAEATGRSALEMASSSTQYRLMLPLALSALVVPLIERGLLDDAEDVLVRHRLAVDPPAPTSTANPFLAARAKLRLAQGRVADAVADTAVWLERQRRRGGLNAVGASSIMHPAEPPSPRRHGDRPTARA